MNSLVQILAFALFIGSVASRTCDRFGAISGCSTNCNVGTEDVEDGGVCGARQCCRTNCAGPRTFCIGIRQSCESTGEGFDEVDGTCPDDDNFICCAPRNAAPVASGPLPNPTPYPPYQTTPPPVQYTTTPAPPPPPPETPAPPQPAPETTESPPVTAAPNPEPDNPPKQPPTPPKQPPTPAPPPAQDDQENTSQAQPPAGKSKKYHKNKKQKKQRKKHIKKAKTAKAGKAKTAKGGKGKKKSS